MSTLVWKYAFPREYKVHKWQTFLMPRSARIVSCQLQNGFICMWAECESQATQVHRDFMLVATGSEVPNSPGGLPSIYRGTVLVDPFVWHVYESQGFE